MKLASAFLCLVASPVFADGLAQADFDACLAGLSSDASGAACVLPIRKICSQVAGQGEVAAELDCLNQTLASLNTWTDAHVADTSDLAPLAGQVAGFREELIRACTGQIAGEGIEDKRDFALCQIAGVSALYRNLKGRGAAQ